VLIFILQALFQSAQHLYEKKGTYPDPYLWLLDPDPGGPKTCGSGSPTLETIITVINMCIVHTWRSSCLISSRQAAMYLPSLSRLFLFKLTLLVFLKQGFGQCCGTVTIFTDPVPTFEKLWFRFRLLKKLWFRFRFLLLESYGSGSGSGSSSISYHKKQIFL
jgi:hypothetical protein